MASDILPSLGLGLFLVFPAGVVLGVITERIALKPPMGNRLINSGLWNTFTKTAVALSVVHGLQALSVAGDIDKSADDSFRGKQVVAFSIWNVFFCVGVKIGSVLQPVGLTGGIACGKSTVAKILTKGSGRSRKSAFTIVDTDTIAHEILLSSNTRDSVYHKVLSVFGDGILEDEEKLSGEGGKKTREIDRRKLGDVVFRDPMNRRKLNSITHPAITKVMLKQIIKEGLFPSKSDSPIVSVDIPLLYEVGYPMRFLVGLEIVVACAPSVQLERLIKRNTDLSREQCEKRIESQLAIDRKVQMANFVVWNNGSIGQLEQDVEKLRIEVTNRVIGWGFTLPRLVGVLGLATMASNLFFKH